MAITYPVDCNTPAERMEWLHAARELMRFVHNIISYWLHNDITQTQYDNPPLPDVPDFLRDDVRRVFTYLKNKYPYKPRLTMEDWDRFRLEDYVPRRDKISTQIHIQEGLLEVSTRWRPNVESI